MNKRYISVDVEASGPTPGRYSMLSFGACVVGDRRLQFYRELKPLNKNFSREAMKIGCLGLRCLGDLINKEQYDPKSRNFDPRKVLQLLSEKGEEPSKAMADYAKWVRKVTRDFTPIEAAAPIKFDSMFMTWYFDNFYDGKNPFGHSGEDMNSFYRGLVRNPNASMKDLGLTDMRICPHNALEDALHQAKEFEMVLSLMALYKE